MHDRSIFSDSAARLRALYAEIKRAFAEERHGPAHTAACHAFHASYDALANLFGYFRATRRLRHGRASCSMEPTAYRAAPDEQRKAFL